MLKFLKTTAATETAVVETTTAETAVVAALEETTTEVLEITTEATEVQETVVKEEANLLVVEEAMTGTQALADALQEELILPLLEREDQEEAKNYFI